jgi:hypothetical protein
MKHHFDQKSQRQQKHLRIVQGSKQGRAREKEQYGNGEENFIE